MLPFHLPIYFSLLGFHHFREAMAMAPEESFKLSLSPESTDFLSPGAFVVAGLTRATEFAQYLEDNPEIVVKQLLLSDSSVWDIENNYGFLNTSKYYPRRPVFTDSDWVPFGGPEDDLDIPDEEADAVAHNTKLSRKRKRLLRDHLAVLDRILNRTHTSLETFSYLLYIANSPRYNRRRQPSTKAEKELRLFNRDFPRLRDLTVKASGVWKPLARTTAEAGRKVPDNMEDGQIRRTQVFPPLDTVTHLHIMGYQDTCDYERRSLSSYRDQFKNLSHFRLTDQRLLPHEIYPCHVNAAGFWGMVEILIRGLSLGEEWLRPLWKKIKGKFWGVSYEEKCRPFPKDLTVIVQPGFSPMLENSGFCGPSGVDYNDDLHRLDSMQDIDVHLSWPVQSDWVKYGRDGVFPLERAILNFKERIFGGDGEWKIGEELRKETPREWWWNSGQEESNVTHEEL
ncbi:hypothetical protein EV368DRAFT_79737 [Lentinula lateritia]|nr:hypothetical protein EV368DRAFT_79737 [Lentinula lateritia]